MTNTPQSNSFARVITRAAQHVRLGLTTPPTTPPNITEPPPTQNTINLKTVRTRPITSASDTIAFSQVTNRAGQALGVPASMAAQNQLTSSQLQTIENLITQLEQLRQQLASNVNNQCTTPTPIPIHAPPVGETLL